MWSVESGSNSEWAHMSCPRCWQNHRTHQIPSDSKHMFFTESLAVHTCAKLENPGTYHPHPTMKKMTAKTLSKHPLQMTQQPYHGIWLSVWTQTKTKAWMVLDADGGIRNATVPDELDLEQTGTTTLRSSKFNQRLYGKLQKELLHLEKRSSSTATNERSSPVTCPH